MKRLSDPILVLAQNFSHKQRFGLLVAFGIAVSAVGVLSTVAGAQNADDARYPCRAVHTFDYWVGTFDATPWNAPNTPSGGVLRNTREYDGCVFVERWNDNNPKGANGMSIVFYDDTRKTWRMVWNDDSNGSSVFDEGTFKDGTMRFVGWKLNPMGQRVMISNVLQDVSPGVIRHIFSTSADSGKTWVTRSDGRFVKRK